MTLLSCSYYTTGIPSPVNGRSVKSDWQVQGSGRLVNGTRNAWGRCRPQDSAFWFWTLGAACDQALRSASGLLRLRQVMKEEGQRGPL